jgi:DNA-directed RNA polymerase subunit RPC12/RpoP
MATCRGCGAEIRFEPTTKGKLMPVDADGTSHFATCPQAERFKKPAPPQDECLSCGSREVDRLPGTGQHHAAIRCRDCGAHRWLRRPQETTP